MKLLKKALLKIMLIIFKFEILTLFYSKFQYLKSLYSLTNRVFKCYSI